MLVSYSHRFIFIHVGKTGGMSMRGILQPFCTEPEKFKMRRPARTAAGGPNPLYTAWQTLLLHATARDVQEELPPEVFNKFYKFAFVRNPWDLQVSMYHFILREPTAPRHEEIKSLGSFAAFIEWVVETPKPYPKGITKLQTDMITDARGKILMDFVGHYETLDRDFDYVQQHLGIDAALPHLNQSRHDDYRSYYNARTKALVGEHFKTDIENFDYNFDGCRSRVAQELSR